MVSNHISVSLDSAAKRTLLSEFREKGVTYQERAHSSGRTFVVNDASTVVEVINAISGLGLTTALVTWLHGRANRKIEVFGADGLKVITKGVSTKDVERILKSATKLHAKED